MKFLLIMVLMNPQGAMSIASVGPFDDVQACETAGLLTVPHIPSGARLERHCVPTSTAKK
jgi:hypothetical protein